MKPISKFFILVGLLTNLVLSSGCDEDSSEPLGEFVLFFDNKLETQRIALKEFGDATYQFTDGDGQSYNVSSFAYYISESVLEGADGTKHVDPLLVSASEVKGYYHVSSGESSSNVITLGGITEGKYNKVTFTVGVSEAGVQEGAAGGILDPAKGAPFWNWNAGYIAMQVEGNASNSGQEHVDWGNGNETLAGTFALHVGGWKDVEPTDGTNPKFVNNIKTITLDFDSNLLVGEEYEPEAHIKVDFAELLKGIDFSTTYAVHRPDLGSPFADKFQDMFILDHVHQ